MLSRNAIAIYPRISNAKISNARSSFSCTILRKSIHSRIIF